MDARADEVPFAGSAVHAIRTAQQVHIQLSAMADQKASILMGASFVIFTIAIGRSAGGGVSLPLLILAAGAFVSAIFAVLALMPATGRSPHAPTNLLFFGCFTTLGEEEFLNQLMAQLRTDEDVYRLMARDIYQNGVVLARKKYRLLGYAYRLFLLGLTLSFTAFVVSVI